MPNTVDDCKVPFFVLDVYYEFNKSVCCEFFPVLNRFSGLHRKIHPETGSIFSSEKYPKELLRRGQICIPPKNWIKLHQIPRGTPHATPRGQKHPETCPVKSDPYWHEFDLMLVP